jgi:BMFP domain-containing protein YqiC
MRKSIGFLVVLYTLSQVFSSAFNALDSAARESFETIEMAAMVTQSQLKEIE